MGLQTISSLFLARNYEEFIASLRPLLPAGQDVDLQVNRMKSRLQFLADKNDPVQRIVDEHSKYVYGGLSNKYNTILDEEILVKRAD